MSKLRYKNIIGKVYEDKIAIGTNKFFYNDMKAINLVKIKSKKYNNIALTCALISLTFSLINYEKIIVFIVLLLNSIILLIFYKLHKRKKYYIEIHSISNDEKIFLSIRNKQKNAAKAFIKATNSSKTVLKILTEINK